MSGRLARNDSRLTSVHALGSTRSVLAAHSIPRTQHGCSRARRLWVWPSSTVSTTPVRLAAPAQSSCSEAVISASPAAVPVPMAAAAVPPAHLPATPNAPAPSRRALLLQGVGALAGGAAAAQPASPAVAAPAVAAASEPAAACVTAEALAAGALRGSSALRDPAINRGLATAVSVRRRYGLDGLLPAPVAAPAVEVTRAAAAVGRAAAASEQPLLAYSALMALREADQATFFALVQQDVERYLPLIYTPTVGDACLQWGSLLPRPAGLTVSLQDAGRVSQLVDNWAEGRPQARIAVVTDGERILGLGDLGAHGLGIPVGKAAVYGAAGVDPGWILPVVLDVGCNTQAVVDDPLYLGLRRPRERGPAYYDLVDELVQALRARYGPDLLVHWEDVGFAQAFPLLARLQSRGVPTFNDDIQATAAVTLAALLGAERLEGVAPLERQTFLFFGAGQANLGVAQLLCAELEARGLPPAAAGERVWLVDRAGLVTSDRPALPPAKARYAKPLPAGLPGPGPGRGGAAGLEALVAALRPSALIGAATVGGAFSPGVLSALAQVQPSAASRPLVFALSNPTSRSECSYEEAMRGTAGRAVFASGTQFPPLLAADGRRLLPAQANNCLVFPGLGAGCVAAGATSVTDGMLLAAARAVAALATEEDLGADCVLPRVSRLGDCAAAVAAAVARAAATDMVAASTAGSAACLGPLLRTGTAGGAAVPAARPAAGSEDELTACLRRQQYRPL